MLRRKRKTVHFIRHAESEHNAPPYNVRLKDPHLSGHGRAQAESLGQQFPYLQDVDLIVCSPMRRTLTTALLAFKDHLQSTNQELIALPELQELSNRPCDTGSSLAELLTEFREAPVALSHVPFDWDSKDRMWSPTEQRTLARMARARAWLRGRSEANIVVIGHAQCLQLLVRDAPDDYDNDGIQEILLGLLPVWRNCEWRSYTVEEDDAKVLLFEESRASGKAKSKGENVPRLGDADKHRKSSQTSTETSHERSHVKSWSVWSRGSSRTSSTAETSPEASMRKSRTWPNQRTSRPSSLIEPRKLLAAMGIRK